MQIIVFVAALFVSVAAAAQHQFTYYIVKKDSSAFNCLVLAEKPKGYVVKLENDSITAILRSDIAQVYLIDNEGNKKSLDGFTEKEVEEIKKNQLLQNKHKDWDTCLLVLHTGDSLRCKVERSRDYSSGGLKRNALKEVIPGIPIPDAIVFTTGNDSEFVFKTSEIKELYVYDKPEEYRQYIALADDDWSGVTDLYRVIVQGKCKLVYKLTNSQMYGTGLNPLTGNITPAHYPVWPIQIAEKHELLVYYKNQFTYMNSNFGFKRTCSEIFDECPALVQQIENGILKIAHLREIVKEFNRCMESK